MFVKRFYSLLTNKNKFCQLIIILFILTIQIIDSTRTITNLFYEPIQLITNHEIKIFNHLNIKEILGNFGAQFAFYTVWINYLAILTISWTWLFPTKINSYWKSYILTYLLIISFGFWFLIAPFWKWGNGAWNDFISIHQHLIILLVAIWWYFSTDIKKTSFKISLKYLLIIPFLYFSFILTIYFISNMKLIPYIFLYFQNVFLINLSLPLSITITILIIILILLLHLVLNFYIIKINNIKTDNKQLDKKCENGQEKH